MSNFTVKWAGWSLLTVAHGVSVAGGTVESEPRSFECTRAWVPGNGVNLYDNGNGAEIVESDSIEGNEVVLVLGAGVNRFFVVSWVPRIRSAFNFAIDVNDVESFFCGRWSGTDIAAWNRAYNTLQYCFPALGIEVVGRAT